MFIQSSVTQATFKRILATNFGLKAEPSSGHYRGT